MYSKIRMVLETDILLKQEVDLSINTLRSGGILLCPTDTIWGLSADALQVGSVSRLMKIKHRPGEKSFILFFRDIMHVASYYEGQLELSEIFGHHELRPVTYILDDMTKLPDFLRASDGSVGIRIPETSKYWRYIFKNFDHPVISTSANLHGDPSPSIYDDINPALISEVDFAVDYDRNGSESGGASKIVKISRDGGRMVIRD